jgi:hypothetical protein
LTLEYADNANSQGWRITISIRYQSQMKARIDTGGINEQEVASSDSKF